MTYGAFPAAGVLGQRPRKQEQVRCIQGSMPRLMGFIL